MFSSTLLPRWGAKPFLTKWVADDVRVGNPVDVLQGD